MKKVFFQKIKFCMCWLHLHINSLKVKYPPYQDLTPSFAINGIHTHSLTLIKEYIMNIMKFAGKTFATISGTMDIADAAISNFQENQAIDHKIAKIEKLQELNDAMAKLGTDPSTVISTAQENIKQLDEALEMLK